MHPVYDVCLPCAAACGWDPRCEACIAEEKDANLVRDDHIATCDPGRRGSASVSEEPAGSTVNSELTVGDPLEVALAEVQRFRARVHALAAERDKATAKLASLRQFMAEALRRHGEEMTRLGSHPQHHISGYGQAAAAAIIGERDEGRQEIDSLKQRIAEYEHAITVGRRQAADGWTLHREEEQWSVWWKTPGGGLNVSVPTDDTDDPEAAAHALHADVGGEVKHRLLRTYESQWGPAEQRDVCCDLHGRNCEQGGEECCERCTEAHHFEIGHGGVPCSSPDLSAAEQPEGS